MRDLPQQMAMQQLQGSGTPVTDGSIQEGDVLSYTMTDGVGKITAHVRPPGAGQMKKAHDELPEDNAAMWTELEKRADRIEALEFEVEHERYNVEKTAQEAAKRIKVLEAALKEAGEMWIRKDNRIERLEHALRCADQFITNGIELGYIRMPDADTPDSAHKTPGIIRAVLAPEQDK